MFSFIRFCFHLNELSKIRHVGWPTSVKAKILFFKAKLSFSRQTFFLKTKLSFSKQNFPSQDKTYQFTVSIHECMICIESYICNTKPIHVTFLKRLLALAEKIWNETNLQEVAQVCVFETKFGDI